MNIDEVVDLIPDEKLRSDLAKWVNDWKEDDTDITRLEKMLSKWHSYTWFEDDERTLHFLNQFDEFRKTAISNIGGLTMNERLYYFGLFDNWDNGNEQQKNKIRHKLLAQA